MSASGAHELDRAKRRLRASALALRDAIPPQERERASREIKGHVMRLIRAEADEEHRTVSTFWSFGSEVSTRALVTALHVGGWRIALPRVVEGDLELRSYRPGDPLARASLGAKEPTGGEPVAPEELSAVVTPGVAFDRRGFRIGYGGGYYDRLLARTPTRVLTLGICFEVQLVEEVPHGGSDRAVSVVVTEDGPLRPEPPDLNGESNLG